MESNKSKPCMLLLGLFSVWGKDCLYESSLYKRISNLRTTVAKCFLESKSK